VWKRKRHQRSTIWGVFVLLPHLENKYQLDLVLKHTSVVAYYCAVVTGCWQRIFVRERQQDITRRSRTQERSSWPQVPVETADQIIPAHHQITSRGDHPPRDPTISFQPHRGGVRGYHPVDPACVELHRSAFKLTNFSMVSRMNKSQ